MNELIKQMATDVSAMTLVEKLTGGLVVTLFSMGIVVSVLVLLMFVIKLLTAIVSGSENKAAQKNKPAVVEISQTPEIVDEVSTNDDEVAAAIVAAINSYYSSSQSKIVITNVTRKDSNSWSNAGILEQLNSRL